VAKDIRGIRVTGSKAFRDPTASARRDHKEFKACRAALRDFRGQSALKEIREIKEIKATSASAFRASLARPGSKEVKDSHKLACRDHRATREKLVLVSKGFRASKVSLELDFKGRLGLRVQLVLACRVHRDCKAAVCREVRACRACRATLACREVACREPKDCRESKERQLPA